MRRSTIIYIYHHHRNHQRQDFWFSSIHLTFVKENKTDPKLKVWMFFNLAICISRKGWDLGFSVFSFQHLFPVVQLWQIQIQLSRQIQFQEWNKCININPWQITNLPRTEYIYGYFWFCDFFSWVKMLGSCQTKSSANSTNRTVICTFLVWNFPNRVVIYTLSVSVFKIHLDQCFSVVDDNGV